MEVNQRRDWTLFAMSLGFSGCIDGFTMVMRACMSVEFVSVLSKFV